MVINCLLSVHTKAFFDKQVEGLILPLFDQYGIKKDMHTYRHLIKMYSELQDYKSVNSLWDSLKNDKVTPDMYILNGYLKNCIKTNDTERVVEALESFQKHNYTPLYMYLKAMNKTEKLPLRVWALLQEFKTYYSRDLKTEYGKRLRIHQFEDKFTK